MKYVTSEDGDQPLRVSLTPWGRVREGAWGMLVGLLWGSLGMAIFFVPDYFGAYSKSAELEGVFWKFAAVALTLIIVGVGVRRATRTRFWSAGKQGITVAERAMFGTPEPATTVALTSVKEIVLEEGPRARLIVSFAAGNEVTLASSWIGRQEVVDLAARLSAATGRETTTGSDRGE